jgi:hypothetical protein
MMKSCGARDSLMSDNWSAARSITPFGGFWKNGRLGILKEKTRQPKNPGRRTPFTSTSGRSRGILNRGWGELWDFYILWMTIPLRRIGQLSLKLGSRVCQWRKGQKITAPFFFGGKVVFAALSMTRRR